MQRVGIREHIALRKRPGFAVGVSQAGDAVVEKPSARWQQRCETLSVGVDPPRPDVFDHADAGDRVEALAGEIAVVHHADLDPIAKARRGDPLACNSRLRLGKRDANDLDTVAGCGVDSEAAPAAADVEHAFVRCQSKLVADQLELLPLGRFERIGAVREDRAAVGHRLIEKERKELRWQVVVMADGARVASLRAACTSGPKLGLRQRGGQSHPAGHECGEQQPQTGAPLESWRLPAVEEDYHFVDVVDLEIPRHEGATDAELAGGPECLSYRSRRAEQEGRPAVFGRIHPAPIPKRDRERPLGQRCGELLADRARVCEGHAPILRRSDCGSAGRPPRQSRLLVASGTVTGSAPISSQRAMRRREQS